MSLPVAPAPFAVLVLAWDETTPATHVLLEATQTLVPAPDPIAVLVPTGPLAEAFSQEEFLPLEASPAPPEALPTLPAEAEFEATQVPAAEATETADPTSFLPAAAGSLPELASISATDAAALPQHAAAEVAPAAAATVTALVGPALVWQEVRVLHLPTSTVEQPGLAWAGEPKVPAAPYLGSSKPAQAIRGFPAVSSSTVAATFLATSSSTTQTISALRSLSLPGAGPVPAAAESLSLLQPAYLTDELPAAAEAELDALPLLAATELVPTAGASTTELSEAAADPTDSFAVDTSPVQTELSQPAPPLLTATDTTSSPIENQVLPTAEPPALPSLSALHPSAQAFDAPNLNFQIIQYARLAVPQALTQQPFEAIYAPAWPTWLAAQELRQRTGQPLVLHLAQLAATDDELIDLAAGWVAEVQRQALHRADLILTETLALAQRLRHELALPAHRVRSVPAADAAAVAQALRTARRE